MTSESFVRNHDYGLAVVDIMLPGKGGLAFLPEFKSYGASVIFLTTKGELPGEVKGLTGSAEGHMVKLFGVLELLVRIDKILKCFQQEEPEIHIKGVVIDPEKRTVTRGGQEISSKSMGSDCLMALVHNRNKTLTRK